MLPIIVATAYIYTVRNFHHCCNPLYIYSQKLLSLLQPSIHLQWKLLSLLQPSIHIQLETSIIVATLYSYTVRNFYHCCNPLYTNTVRNFNHCCNPLYIYSQKLPSLLQPSIHIQLETSIIVATAYTYTVRNFHHCCNPLYIYSQKLPSLL